jgi:hypothetical protein
MIPGRKSRLFTKSIVLLKYFFIQIGAGMYEQRGFYLVGTKNCIWKNYGFGLVPVKTNDIYHCIS